MAGGASSIRVRRLRSAIAGTRVRRLLYGSFVLALMMLICAPLFADRIAYGAPIPAGGTVSYWRWGALTAPVSLAGEWRVTWIGGGRPAIAPGTHAMVAVPGPWTAPVLPGGGHLPATGAARYELLVRDLPAGRYTLHIPVTYAAAIHRLNGRPVDRRGVFGLSPAATRYDLRSTDLTFETDGRPLAIAVDLAVFFHRETGFGGTPVLGLAEPMRQWAALQWMRALLFHGGLLLLGLNALVSYLFRRTDRPSLYLALTALCMTPAAAIVSFDDLLLIVLPGLGFTAILFVQYLVTVAGLTLFFAYACALFPQEVPGWLRRLVTLLIGVYAVALVVPFLTGDTLLASRVALAWPVVMGTTLIAVTAIVWRAAMRGRDGAPVFLIGIAVFTFFAIVTALMWAGVLPDTALLGSGSLQLGLLMLLFSHFVVGAERWSLAIVAAEQTADDLRQLIAVNSAITSEIKLDVLLARIVEVTSRILNADRSTLLLHDERVGELWSLVAEGLTTREIRIPADSGLAGHVFLSGETLNIADAYADPRFNRSVDLSTDYRTGSILTMPVTARDGRRLGVMQALNRRDGRPFSADDVKRMLAFSAQAAIAIDNATLFREVVNSRNYNESILRSMSSGVVTLDRDAGIGKLNAAASAILNVPADALEGLDAHALLAATNPWLIAEIDAVDTTGERKSLIDVDLVTGGDRTVSANINIVPLLGEEGPVGLLLLIEDISEGKRMQGAMRRFMTQKVVDQVLSRGDELLFGTACEATVLFADIRNFTTMAEALTPRETVDMLNEAFTEFFEAVAAADGVLDKFIGDAIMAVYGAPLPTGRDPENAVDSAVQMLRSLHHLNLARTDRALAPLRLGVGIATGEVVAGTIGSPKRMDYTVIGDSVNLSARLQDLTKVYGVEILVCEATAAALSGRYSLRELDVITVRGRQRPAKIFEVLGEADDRTGAMIASYARGRDRLAVRDWPGATDAFAQALALVPDDGPARLMIARARTLADTPPAADWNGVWKA